MVLLVGPPLPVAGAVVLPRAAAEEVVLPRAVVLPPRAAAALHPQVVAVQAVAHLLLQVDHQAAVHHQAVDHQPAAAAEAAHPPEAHLVEGKYHYVFQLSITLRGHPR